MWSSWVGPLAANETAVLAFMTTNTAAAAPMVAWVLFDLIVQVCRFCMTRASVPWILGMFFEGFLRAGREWLGLEGTVMSLAAGSAKIAARR